MKTAFRILALLMVGAVLLMGCSKPSAPTDAQGEGTQQPATQPSPTIPPAPEQPSKGSSAKLFPTEDKEFQFFVREHEQNSQVTEHLLRDGDRAVGVYNGKVYATWHLTDTGVWRQDSKNPQVMLRFLPPSLNDGDAWSQQSGEATVLFRLSEENGAEGRCGRVVDEEGLACWKVTVVNRGEALSLWFLEGVGPVYAENQGWAKSSSSFWKYRNGVRTAAVDPTTRSEWLGAAQASVTGEMPAVTPLTAGEYTKQANQQHWDSQQGEWIGEYDLNGLGPVLIRGLPHKIEDWGSLPVSFYRKGELTPLGKFEPPAGKKLRLTPLSFDGYEGSFFLLELGGPGELNQIQMLGYDSGLGQVVPGWGWEIKTYWTHGHSVTTKPDGEILVARDLNDPARHTKTTRYGFTGFKEAAGFGIGAVEKLATEITPTREELVYPTTPEAVLQAAFTALWLDQTAELSRYFADEAEVQRFVEGQKIPEPMYELGSVKVGKLVPPADAHSPATIEPAELGTDGATEFRVFTSGYEYAAYQWGRITFGRDEAGRWVIRSLEIENFVVQGP